MRLFAVNIQEEDDAIKKFLDDAELKVTVALDSKGDTAKAYLATAIPQTVIIGKDGTVQVVHIGALPSLEDDLSKEIDDLLGGKDFAAETLAAAKSDAAEDADEKKAEEAKPPAPPAKTPAAGKPAGAKVRRTDEPTDGEIPFRAQRR